MNVNICELIHPVNYIIYQGISITEHDTSPDPFRQTDRILEIASPITDSSRPVWPTATRRRGLSRRSLSPGCERSCCNCRPGKPVHQRNWPEPRRSPSSCHGNHCCRCHNRNCRWRSEAYNSLTVRDRSFRYRQNRKESCCWPGSNYESADCEDSDCLSHRLRRDGRSYKQTGPPQYSDSS